VNKGLISIELSITFATADNKTIQINYYNITNLVVDHTTGTRRLAVFSPAQHSEHNS